MEQCTNPDCTGIVEDGYCNVCGMAPASTLSPSASAPAPTARPMQGATPPTAPGRPQQAQQVQQAQQAQQAQPMQQPRPPAGQGAPPPHSGPWAGAGPHNGGAGTGPDHPDPTTGWQLGSPSTPPPAGGPRPASVPTPAENTIGNQGASATGQPPVASPPQPGQPSGHSERPSAEGGGVSSISAAISGQSGSVESTSGGVPSTSGSISAISASTGSISSGLSTSGSSAISSSTTTSGSSLSSGVSTNSVVLSSSISGRFSSRTSTTGGRNSSRRGTLGAGLIDVPPVPTRDPAEAILKNPEVREKDRFCSGCNEPVGRSHEGIPGRTEGFCRKCGRRFSFKPRLQTGDLVGGQYEVLGCLAHGGFGWIYLARDHNVNDRWVVLKGLLNAGDAEAMAAAAAERAFLAEVEHPNIVKIYNFIQHLDPTTRTMVGYIVMEYVGGRSLKDKVIDLRKEQGDDAAIPLGEAIAYMLEVLRALGHLHERGMLYCDFKPENAIQSEEQLKLIDLGGVRRIDDDEGDIYGSVGYQAPEIATAGASIPSDLYTVGRTLAVLSFRFKGFATKYATELPPREEIPLLQRYESFDRFLRRATHQDPALRFQDASEMADQLTGVLREVLAGEDGRPRPAASSLFGPELEPAGTDIPERPDDRTPPLGYLDPHQAASALPAPLIGDDDPAASFLAGLTNRDPDDVLHALTQSSVQSPEVLLMMCRVSIQRGDIARARSLLADVDSRVPGDWRVAWYDAVAALAARDVDLARHRFDELYSLLPGEPAVKLALAFSYELLGDLGAAARCYETVWRTDNTYVSAAFGLARTRSAHMDRNGAIEVLDSVPKISSRYIGAQIAALACAVRGRPPQGISVDDLSDAGARLESLQLDSERHGRLSVELLHAALGYLEAGQPVRQGAEVLGAPLSEKALRRALDSTYRSLAHLASEKSERYELVNLANAMRPRTWV